MSVSDNVRVEYQDAAAIGSGVASVRVPSVQAVLIGNYTADYVFSQAQNIVAIGSDERKDTVVEVQAMSIVIVGQEGVVPDLQNNVRAFQYDLDGHIFYGLHIEGQGTFLYDQTTGQWTRWYSGGLTYWNTQFHTRWNGGYYAATLSDNSIVEIDPDSILDDSFRVNSFVATGRLEVTSRRYVKNPEIQIFGSVGLRGGVVQVRYSDDDGANWSSYRSITVTAGQRDANVIAYNFGSVRQPGRVYEIYDEGTLRRIQSLQVKLGDGDG